MSIHAGFVLGSTLLVLLLGSIRGDHTLAQFFDLRKSRVVLKKTVQSLEAETAALASEIQKISESPNYARKVLREKYHVTDNNEKIIFFAD